MRQLDDMKAIAHVVEDGRVHLLEEHLWGTAERLSPIKGKN